MHSQTLNLHKSTEMIEIVAKYTENAAYKRFCLAAKLRITLGENAKKWRDRTSSIEIDVHYIGSEKKLT